MPLITIQATNIDIDLWVLSSIGATAIAYVTVTTYALLAIEPANRRLHTITMPLSWVFWFGRAAAATGQIADGAEPVFWTVVATSVAIGAADTALHLHAVRSLAADHTLTSRGP